MKIVSAFLCGAGVCFALSLSANAQQPPAKWGPGCNKALLDGDFSLTKAPEMPCAKEKKEFIDEVIGEVKGGYGGTMVTTDSPHPHMDTPEFTAFFLRAFAEPGKSLDDYDYHFERLMSRVSQHMAMIADPRLDWDLWRAWLLFENTAHTSDYYESKMEIGGSKVMNGLDGARELLWNYLSRNADAILKDEKRRAWWITKLTADLEAEGGRPQRRWFLLSLLSTADPKREALEKIPAKEEASERRGQKIPMRHPHPLDPFLLVTGKNPKAPAFSDALTKMAFDNKLSLTVLGLDPASQPATMVHTVSLEMTKWPVDQSKVINQESWSARSDKKDDADRFSGDEWGVGFSRPVGRRAGFSSVSFPEDRKDGVYFFVFNQRLYVWPKAKMDTAVIQLLRTANLIDAPAAADFEKRGFAPLKETLVKENPGK